jgi:hypothetical protein
MSLPVVLAVGLLMGYNKARFGSVWESGYVWADSPYLDKELRKEIIENGLFQVKYISANMHDYFLRMPELVSDERGRWEAPYIRVNNPGGVSFLLIAPIFMYVVCTDLKNIPARNALLTSGVMMLALLMYYSNGGSQVGPRYMTDVIPYAYVALVSVFKKSKLGILGRMFVWGAGYVNLYLYVVSGGI